MSEINDDEDKRTAIDKLATGLLAMDLNKEMQQPEYSAINRIHFDRELLQRRRSYSNEIQRVINEAKLTTYLLEHVGPQEIIEIGDKTYEAEEIINYHNGVFLDQVHQLKDKLLKLIGLLITQPTGKKVPEPKKVKPMQVFKQSGELIDQIGIRDQISEWDEHNHLGRIATALKKRTGHHHGISRLPLNSDFQKIKMSRHMSNPQLSAQLNEKGKAHMKKIGDEAFIRWREDMLRKQSDTLNRIEDNINEVADALITYFKIPVDLKEVGMTMVEYTEFLGKFEVKNQASISKIQQPIKLLLDEYVSGISSVLGERLKNVYLVGSCGRGEFISGSSDVNLYLIIGGTHLDLVHNDKLNVKVITEDNLQKPEFRKDRFIMWSDGVVLLGEPIKFNTREFPEAGANLTFLLNKGVIEDLESLRDDVEALNNPNDEIMREHTLKATKIVMDYDFGVAMANQPYYTASRIRKLAHTKKAFPSERRTQILANAYLGKGIFSQDDFVTMINVVLENARSTYEKLLEISNEDYLD